MNNNTVLAKKYALLYGNLHKLARMTGYTYGLLCIQLAMPLATAWQNAVNSLPMIGFGYKKIGRES